MKIFIALPLAFLFATHSWAQGSDPKPNTLLSLPPIRPPFFDVGKILKICTQVPVYPAQGGSPSGGNTISLASCGWTSCNKSASSPGVDYAVKGCLNQFMVQIDSLKNSHGPAQFCGGGRMPTAVAQVQIGQLNTKALCESATLAMIVFGKKTGIDTWDIVAMETKKGKWITCSGPICQAGCNLTGAFDLSDSVSYAIGKSFDTRPYESARLTIAATLPNASGSTVYAPVSAGMTWACL